MITNMMPLEGALHQIAWAADALEGVRRSVNAENTHVFPVTAEACIHHIREATPEARAYVETLVPATTEAMHAVRGAIDPR